MTKLKVAPRLRTPPIKPNREVVPDVAQVVAPAFLSIGQKGAYRRVLNHVFQSARLPTEPTARQLAAEGIAHQLGAANLNDPLEQMLVALMIVTYDRIMQCSVEAQDFCRSLEERESYGRQAERLSKSFMQMLEALDRHRGKGSVNIGTMNVSQEQAVNVIGGAENERNSGFDAYGKQLVEAFCEAADGADGGTGRRKSS